MGDKDSKKYERTIFTPNYSSGIKTNRDSWIYNYSKTSLQDNVQKAIGFYNSEVDRYLQKAISDPDIDPLNFIDYDPSKFSWDVSQKSRDLPKGIKYTYKPNLITDSTYRPFVKQWLYLDRCLINSVYQIKSLFPNEDSYNIALCITGVGSLSFSCLMTNRVMDLCFVKHGNGGDQCFPLYWYEENRNKQCSLFDEESNDDYIRRDGITDWILKEVRTRYGAKNITKEMIFYYVYGLLHSKDYRERFAADLKKSLPRIPIVDSLDDFMDFYKAGKALADLHLNYETVAPYPDVVVHGDRQVADDSDYDYFRVVDKMRFKSKNDKSVIIYNGNITIENIPHKAYEYIVNGKSAIEWIVERYAVTQDKKSLIKNDANDWAREHHKPRYILDLLLSVINVSVQTVDIVNSLPKLKFDRP